jgi:hypothetical protein
MTDETTGQQAGPEGEAVSTPEATTTAPTPGTEQTEQNANATENALVEENSEGEEDLPPGLKKRFAKLTAQKYESRRAAEEAAEREAAAKREADELRTRLAALEKAAPADPAQGEAPKPAATPAQQPGNAESLVRSEAEKLVREQQFTAACNAAYEKGKTAHADFDDAVGVLRNVGVMTQPFIEAALETGMAPEILYHLGQNPDAADRLRSLSPVKLGVEMAKLSTSLAKPKPVSAAPAPIKPVDSSARPVVDLENAPMSDFSRIRAEQRATRRR